MVFIRFGLIMMLVSGVAHITPAVAQEGATMPEVQRLAPIPVQQPMRDLRAQLEQASQAIDQADAISEAEIEEANPETDSVEPSEVPVVAPPPQAELDSMAQSVNNLINNTASPAASSETSTADSATVDQKKEESTLAPSGDKKIEVAADPVAQPSSPSTAETEALMALPITRTDIPRIDTKLPEQDTPLDPALSNEGMDMSIDPSLLEGYDEDLQMAPVDETSLTYDEQLRIRLQELDQRARSQAFDRAKRNALPLETYEIRDLLKRLKDTQEAIQKPVRVPPKPQNVIRTISIDPAAPSEVIRLSVGNVTALNFVDITGAPWPILDVSFGGNFDIKPPEPGGNILRITPLRDFAQGNMIIRVLRMTTPITFLLESGGDIVHHRFDARIPEYGPNARMPVIEEPIKTVAGDTMINGILEGVPPAGAERLLVEGVDGRTSAYRIGQTMYVRTPLSLLSPAWQGSATSADGMNVYVLAEAPVLLLSDQGKLERARLSVLTDIQE